MDKILILASNQFSFKESESGMLKEGVTIEYIDINSSSEGNKKGCFSMKETLDIGLKDTLLAVPGFYSVDVGIKPSKDRKPQMYIKNINFLCGVEFTEV